MTVTAVAIEVSAPERLTAAGDPTAARRVLAALGELRLESLHLRLELGDLHVDLLGPLHQGRALLRVHLLA